MRIAMIETREKERKENEIAHGRAIASNAESVWQRDTVAGRQRMENRFVDLRQFFGLTAQGRLLEIGCGTGTWTDFLARTPLQITSLELSQDLLDVARKRCTQPRVEFVLGDAEHLTFADETFD